MEKTLLDMVWVVVAAGLVFLMQAGFAMLETGLSRSKHSINVAIKNLSDFGVSSIVFWAVGFGLMFGASAGGLIGTNNFFFDSMTAWPFVFFLFQTMFASTSATIVSGAVAERMRFSSYLVTTFILSLLVYPVFGHWAWGGAELGQPTGWLVKLGFVDFAGSTVVHSVGGWAALAMLLILGARRGRYRADGGVNPINGSNIPMAVLGVCLLWFGWFGFNGGSTLAMNGDVAGIIVRTSLAGAAGMIGALLIGWPLLKKPDINLVINGSLAGLVAITANCHAVSAASALVIGLVAGVLMIGASKLLDRLHIDDAVGAIPVHLVCGIWGTLAVALFGDPAKLATGLDFWHQLGIQGLGIAVAGAYTIAVVWTTTALLNLISPIRVSESEEDEGLNKAEHGVSTEIHDLYYALDRQARTGDISLRAPVEPFTEAGQIAGMYNTVLDRLEENTVAKGEYVQIMHNVADGMFLVDRQGLIGPYYSAVLENLFGSVSLAGRPLAGVLDAFLPEAVRASLSEFLMVSFDAGYQWRHVEKLNPLAEAEFFQEDGKGSFDRRQLQFFFRRIMDDAGAVDRLLVLVRDVSAERQLAEEVESTREQGRREMELLYRVLHVDPVDLGEFLRGLRTDLSAINECFRRDEESVADRLTRVFRLTHSIKGDAELLELDFIVDKAEVLEERVRVLRGQPEAAGEDFLSLTLLYSDLNSAGEELERLTAKLQGFRGVTPAAATPGARLAASLDTMATRLAKRFGKEVGVTWQGDEMADLPESLRKGITDIVVQLVRNSIYHGIEEPAARSSAGKAAAGRIEIKVNRSPEFLSLVLRDDGAGIDTAKLRQQAQTAGILPAAGGKAEAAGGDRDIVPLIFHPGLSTADTMDEIAGKGIGLSLVKARLREMGGRMSVRTRTGKGCEFRFEIPLAAVSAL